MVRKKRSHMWSNRWIYVVALIAPLISSAQAYKIWIEKNASGVSVVTWTTFIFTGLFWMLYGIIHKDKPIIFTQVLWIILSILVVWGVFLYR